MLRAIARSAVLVLHPGVKSLSAFPVLYLTRSLGSTASEAKKSATPKKIKKLTPKEKILQLNQELLDYIADGDWDNYAAMCCPTLTCFEAEARGAFVEGLDFHKIYYDYPPEKEDKRATMSQPHVRFLAGGRVAVLSYVRLVQKFSHEAGHSTMRVEETRIWEKAETPDGYQLVHFHKSDLEKK